MTRGGKKFYVIFIDDYSRFTRVYLLRNKNEAFDMFLSYKAEVENQLDRKIKRIRYDREAEYKIKFHTRKLVRHPMSYGKVMHLTLNI